MFGRDFNPAYLFQACNVEVEESGDSNSEDETVIEPETHEGIYDPPMNADEWMENLDSCRNSEYEVARTNIAQDQARQKQIHSVIKLLLLVYLLLPVRYQRNSNLLVR